ncbi:hypothetical protein AVEN_230360-1, partial [Araneus ventricosus]
MCELDKLRADRWYHSSAESSVISFPNKTGLHTESELQHTAGSKNVTSHNPSVHRSFWR